ncbi:MAG: tetratricopeptide repeat protein [Candidatus Omnitrophica bacterium]|nr:tetratricopeptide repeat protein [Candidatus Omnitrophota bacterium]
MSCRGVRNLVAALSLMVAVASPGVAEEAADWPKVIAQLQQHLYRAPNHEEARRQLAIAYNNYGVQLGEAGRWDLAVSQFQEAIRLDGANESLRHNFANIRLRQAYDAYQRHQTAEAIQALDHVVALNPELAQAYILRGRIEYDRQKLKEAKAAWQRALELDPAQTDVARQLEQLNQELPVESDFERLSQAHFDIRYEERVEQPVWYDLRDVLFEARRLVGSDFAYWPDHKLVVLVYRADSFRKLRQETPEWVAGQFDGKIRVSLPSVQRDEAWVRNSLFHEYTHALIHDLSHGRCPTWLNEGLAEYQGRTQAPGSLALLTKAYETQQLVPWPQLSDQLTMARPTEQVGLGYEQSYSIVAYLAQRYGFWRFRRLLKAIDGGAAWPDAMESEYHLKLSHLEEDWREWLPELLRGVTR